MGTGRQLFSKLGAGRRQLVQCVERIAEHGTTIQSSLLLIQRPKSFGIIGISFKELAEETLRDFLGRKIHAVQGAEQCQQIQSGSLEVRTEVARDFW